MKSGLNRLAGLVAALLLSGCVTMPLIVPQPVVKPFADGRDWVLMRSLPYDVPATGKSGVVPLGFVTDFASIPRGIWTALPPYERYGPAAIVHDYLYWAQPCTREEADMVLLEAMRESKVPPATRETIYRAVRVGGRRAWIANARERAQGLRRIIPPDRIESIPPDATWPEFRKTLATP